MMRRVGLSKAEQEQLFVGAVDGALPERDASRLKAELEGSAELKADFERYQKAVGLLRSAPREQAPVALSNLVMRRVRRRRLFGARSLHTTHMQYRVPIEVILPILIGALVAAFLIFSAR